VLRDTTNWQRIPPDTRFFFRGTCCRRLFTRYFLPGRGLFGSGDRLLRRKRKRPRRGLALLSDPRLVKKTPVPDDKSFSFLFFRHDACLRKKGTSVKNRKQARVAGSSMKFSEILMLRSLAIRSSIGGWVLNGS
jgi:hypothetical protein